jgi:XcyI-like restriction endonuclease
MTNDKITVPTPDMQFSFSLALAAARKDYLQDALGDTVAGLDIEALDRELARFVPKGELRSVAARGLRGELLFPVPSVLIANPKLLAYYRLLLGFSQKAFYSTGCGTGLFKAMEDRGKLSERAAEALPALCEALMTATVHLMHGLGVNRVSKELLDDLTLLTLGPQLRGGANVKKGTAGIQAAFSAIHEIVRSSCTSVDARKFEIKNAANRTVLIECAADPDIVIREAMAADTYRNIIAIEVKAGTDFSNIHNRVGEAEKSHQKARQNGFVECWTVVNVDRMDMSMARRESPSTNRFYRISQILANEGEEYEDFRNRIVALTGIPSA